MCVNIDLGAAGVLGWQPQHGVLEARGAHGRRLSIGRGHRRGGRLTNAMKTHSTSPSQEVRRILADVRQQYDQVHLESERREALEMPRPRGHVALF